MKKKLIYFLVCFAIFGCVEKEKTIGSDSLDTLSIKEIANNSLDSLTIIVKNTSGISTNIGSGIDLDSFERINIDSENTGDIIKIKASKYLKLYIKNENTFETVLCENTDTLFLDISKNKTKISFKNRGLKKYDTLSLDKIFRANLQDLIPKYNKLYRKFMEVDSFTNKIVPRYSLIESNLNDFRNLDESMENTIQKKRQVVENLHNNGLLSFINYKHELSKLDYQYFLSIVKAYNLSNDIFYLNKMKSMFFDYNNILEYPFTYYAYLNIFTTQVVLKEPYSVDLDYAKAYKVLSEFFEGNMLKLFREYCLHQMAQQKASKNQIIEFYNKYKKEYSDTSFATFYEKKYLINEKNLGLSSSSVELIDDKLNRTSLEKIIRDNKGNLIYIDFWASWCAPCRIEMPESKKLQKKLKNKNIVFIYISIDTDKDKWTKAYVMEAIENNNYLALNYPNSNFYNTFQVNTIPRYMLYDQEGRLIYEDAPRPSSEKLEKIILNNLK